MTKSTITRERAQQIFLGNGPEPSASEERELARMALAAMDSEPDCNERKLFCSTDTTRMRKIISVSAGIEDAPLYRHAQPAPVVPDEIYARTAFEAWYKTKYAFQGYEFEITDSGTYVWDNVNHMWNGYRAAMLSGGKS